MLRLKSRASCQCFTNNTTSCATNVTIAQPRNAPPKPNRTKAYKDKGPDDDTVVQTFVPNANSVQNKYFFSDGFGAPISHNRKQDTLTKDKTALTPAERTSGKNWVQGSMWANGYIGKYQSKLQANTGSMDRIARLKANAVSKSNSSRFGVDFSGI